MIDLKAITKKKLDELSAKYPTVQKEKIFSEFNRCTFCANVLTDKNYEWAEREVAYTEQRNIERHQKQLQVLNNILWLIVKTVRHNNQYSIEPGKPLEADVKVTDQYVDVARIYADGKCVLQIEIDIRRPYEEEVRIQAVAERFTARYVQAIGSPIYFYPSDYVLYVFGNIDKLLESKLHDYYLPYDGKITYTSKTGEKTQKPFPFLPEFKFGLSSLIGGGGCGPVYNPVVHHSETVVPILKEEKRSFPGTFRGGL